MKFRIVANLAIAAVSMVVLGSCTADDDSAGLEYMPDMYRSAAIEPYVDYGQIREIENKELKMKRSALVPPAGTVPYYGTDSATIALMLPYFRPAHIAFRQTHGMYDALLSTDNHYEMAAADRNPLKLNEGNKDEIFSKGKALFFSNCAHCHGEKGDGNGPMVESGAYSGVPDYANLTGLSDGQMFYSIYYGKGMMGAHGPILTKKEIWTLVHYIRKFQNADYGMAGATMAMNDSIQ